MESLLRRLEARDFRRLRVGVGPPVLLQQGMGQCVVCGGSGLAPDTSPTIPLPSPGLTRASPECPGTDLASPC